VFIVNKGGDPRTGHQTQKPIAFMEILVPLFSDPGEVILDPFAGSGTTESPRSDSAVGLSDGR
jgi:DNA modification methylase